MDQIREDDQRKNSRAGTVAQTPFSRDPLPFDVLNAVIADISLHTRNIKARDATLQIGKLVLRIDDGQLRIDTLEAVYRNARISTKLNVRSGPSAHVSTRVLLQDFEFGRFLKETNITDEVEVKADLAADLGSLGSSAYNLASNLDGVFAAVFGKGRIKSVTSRVKATSILPKNRSTSSYLLTPGMPACSASNQTSRQRQCYRSQGQTRLKIPGNQGIKSSECADSGAGRIAGSIRESRRM